MKWNKRHQEAWLLKDDEAELKLWFMNGELQSVDILFGKEQDSNRIHVYSVYGDRGNGFKSEVTLSADEFRILMGLGSQAVLEIKSRSKK